jgi:hypothetical protein
MKKKQLKVYTRYSPRAYRKSKQVAEIRLNGIWLAELGFTIQSMVIVSYENGKIILTPEKV